MAIGGFVPISCSYYSPLYESTANLTAWGHCKECTPTWGTNMLSICADAPWLPTWRERMVTSPPSRRGMWTPIDWNDALVPDWLPHR